MSVAKNHHYIPNFLLKQFASKTDGKRRWVWCFHTDSVGRPTEKETETVGVEGNFHGDSRLISLEKDFSKREAKYAELVRRLIAEGPRSKEKPFIDEFVTQLAVRTMAFRSGATDMMRVATHTVIEHLRSPQGQSRIADGMRRQLAIQFATHPQILALPLEEQHRLLRQVATQSKQMDISASTRPLLDALGAIDVDGLAAQAHIRGLQKTFGKWERARTLRKVKWQLIPYPGAGLVLGDVGPMARQPDRIDLVRFSTLGNPAEQVFMPLSPTALLMGSSDQAEAAPTADELNHAAAELSTHFFVSSRCGPAEVQLHALIGHRKEWLSDAEREEVFQEVFNRDSRSRDH